MLKLLTCWQTACTVPVPDVHSPCTCCLLLSSANRWRLHCRLAPATAARAVCQRAAVACQTAGGFQHHGGARGRELLHSVHISHTVLCCDALYCCLCQPHGGCLELMYTPHGSYSSHHTSCVSTSKQGCRFLCWWLHVPAGAAPGTGHGAQQHAAHVYLKVLQSVAGPAVRRFLTMYQPGVRQPL